ncbi:P-loop NTPase [Clostridiaceae bacterium 35-E11]
MPDNQTLEDTNTVHKRGKTLAICSAKGGIGRTVITANLGIALSTKQFKTCIVDGCFQFGDINIAMDLQPMFTIKDVIEQLEFIDEQNILSYLFHHESGVKVLSAPHRPEYADLITSEALDKIWDLLLMHFDYILVDTMAGLPDRSLYFVEKADHILQLTDLEMTTLKNSKLMLEIFDILELRHKVQIIVNRSTMQSVIQATDVPQILGETSLLYVPSNFEIVSKSLNIGIPFILNHRRIDMAKAVFGIADLLTAGQEIALYKPRTLSFAQMILNKFKLAKERSQ